jgi:hypothetical protein
MSTADLRSLGLITDALAVRAGCPTKADGWLCWTNPAASHRWLIPSWKRLTATSRADGVGFFGQLRTSGIDDFPAELEPTVADRAAEQGWLLAYLNVKFVDPRAPNMPRYANLVVVSDRAATRSLDTEDAHIDAVRRAATAYESIRIHRLTLTGGLTARPRIRIIETLSIDYRSVPPARAVIPAGAA